MGIKNLLPLIKSKASSSISSQSLSSFFQKRVAIDSYILFYASSIATNFSPNSKGKVLQDDSGTPTAHLIQILNHSVHYKTHSVSPLWVFDGEPPQLKQIELDRRRLAKEENSLKSESASDPLLQQKFLARAFRLTDQMIQDSKTLVGLLGHSFSVSPSEAEAQCACLASQGLVDYVLSQDSDALVFGAPLVMRAGSELIDLQKVLTGLELSMDQFVDLAVLLGSDYGKGIKGLGQVRVLHMIQKLGTIEKVWQEVRHEEDENDERLKKFQEIREFFKKPFEKPGKVEHGKLDLQGLKEFLVKKKFSEKNAERYVKKLKNLPA